MADQQREIDMLSGTSPRLGPVPRFSRRAALIGAASAALTPLAKPAIAQQFKIRYTLSWLPTGGNAYVYVARQLGYWKQRGIDVELSRGHGSVAAIESVATNTFDLGNAGTGAVLLSIIKGLQLTTVNTINYDSGIGILVPAKGPIASPKDLAGKKIAATAAGSDTPFLPAYFKKIGLPENSVTVVYLDPQIIEQSVMSGQVDGMVAIASSSVPKFVAQKVEHRFFPMSDAGLRLYGSSSLVSDDYLQKNRSLVAAFSEGMLEGLKFSLLNPAETIERFLKEQEEIALTRNARLFAEIGLGIAAAQVIAPESIEHSLGYTDLEEIGRQAALVRAFVGTEKDAAPPPVTRYATNDLIGQVTLSTAEWAKVRENAAPYAAYIGRTL
jgi:ABC-type nitrate/sulfonate/bicarbonate transport system substrate-binding protein